MRIHRRWAHAASAVSFAAAVAWAALALPTSQAAEPARLQQSLPRFEGKTLDGKRVGTELFAKRRGLIFAFGSNDPDADRVAALIDAIRVQASHANIALLGIARDPAAIVTSNFVKRHGFEFPVILDSDGQISARLRVPPGTASLTVVDAQGYVLGTLAGLASQPESQDAGMLASLRVVLELPEENVAATPVLGVLPPAPDFEVAGLDGKAVAKLADYKGKVLVLVFFLPTCPHCHAMLKHLDALAKQLDNPDLAILPVSVDDKKYVIEEMVGDLKISLVPYIDRGEKAQKAYGFQQTVPEVFVIDRKGRVVVRTAGDDAEHKIETRLSMAIRRELGVENPLLLHKTDYTGEETCAVCHREQHATWELTKHASAWETLVEHGADHDPECLKCHTVGFGKPGGFDTAKRQPELRGVQCENCHGRGGPHQSPDFAKAGYEPICLTCHDPQHSLQFSFAERLPLVSHAANQQFANLSLAERKALLAKRDKRERQLFDKSDYVGSAACQSCHAKEHGLWAQSAHARAFTTLEKNHEDKNPDCQRCHTTGFKEPTGFPAGGSALTGVGCESCHGPGKRHVDDPAHAAGTILTLTDKCDTCAITLICGKCHDDANDPGFEFRIEPKLAAIKHGFRPKPTAAK